MDIKPEIDGPLDAKTAVRSKRSVAMKVKSEKLAMSLDSESDEDTYPGMDSNGDSDEDYKPVTVKKEAVAKKNDTKKVKRQIVKKENDKKKIVKKENVKKESVKKESVKKESVKDCVTKASIKFEVKPDLSSVNCKEEKADIFDASDIKKDCNQTKLPSFESDDDMCDEAGDEASTSTKGTKKPARTSKKLAKGDNNIETAWDIVEVLTSNLQLKKWAVQNTVKLLEEDNTIPFIARYRKEQTDNMAVENLHKLKDQLEELKEVKAKIAMVMKTIEKLGKLTEETKGCLLAAQSKEEVEHIYAPYKPGVKGRLAERARELGLEPLAMNVISQPIQANLQSAVQPGKKGLSTVAEVSEGVQHIIADVFAKDKSVLDKIRDLLKNSYIMIETSKSKATNKQSKDEDNHSAVKHKEAQEEAKFENYFNYSVPLKYIKHHQVLAINRGEHKKILSVKVVIPSQLKDELGKYFQYRYIARNTPPHLQDLLKDSFEDSYKRLLEPFMSRQIRGNLTKEAKKASVDVFASNLKRLLLTPPVRGKVVLGVDPGFKNGCKYAVTSASGQVLGTGIFYLHTSSSQRECYKVKEVIQKHRCETVAIGNGTACRETEKIFSDMIKAGAFQPLNVMYCIVSECGASIYSASEEAIEELPDLDISVRGAVSIARRLQDPLAELVKIEPKHVGVGMYQHDIPEAMMKTALDGVVEDCVSFVGVDLNVCGHSLLRRIAGLNVLRAKKIIEWRDKNGGFINREQLKDIKGLGPKTFEQCAGFVRIIPGSRPEYSGRSDDAVGEDKPAVGSKRKAPAGKGPASKRKKTDSTTPNPLDMTCIHPESYPAAYQFLEKLHCPVHGVGQPSLINTVTSYMKLKNVANEASDLGVGVPTMQLIIDGLTQTVDHDMRQEFEKPLFKAGLTSIDSLKVDCVLTGKVVNNTHFGAFVDIGVGQDALIHTSNMPRHLLMGKPSLELGDRVEVTVVNLDIPRKRIGLRLQKLL